MLCQSQVLNSRHSGLKFEKSAKIISFFEKPLGYYRPNGLKLIDNKSVQAASCAAQFIAGKPEKYKTIISQASLGAFN